MSQIKLLSKQSKKIEQEIVTFYKTAGKMVDLNPRMTEIFAYLKIYESLTQKQLKRLTGFSLGTISTTLQLFLQTDIIGRSIIPRTHTNLYSIKPEKGNFVYTPSLKIIEDLEKLDSYIVDKQTELQKTQRRHPVEAKFLHLRLNSLRNYVETQRRQINRKQKYSFFEESTSEILPLNEIIVYPFETKKIEETIMDYFEYYRNDPMRNRLLSIFYTHQSVNQQNLIDQSGFSRSTVSRFLRQHLKTGYIQVLPREYRTPSVYHMNSISLSTLSAILRTDNFIYSSIPRFQEILRNPEFEGQPKRDREEAAFIETKVDEIIERIETFRRKTRFLRKAQRDLSEFLEKKYVQ